MLTKPPTRRPSARANPRAAFTLAEILVVLALGALVLGIVTTVGARLQHLLSTEAARQKGSDQLAAGSELLPLDLRGVAPAIGDIAEAMDSVLQYRVTVASAVVCGGSGSILTAAPFLAAGGRSVVPAVESGDTLWSLTESDSSPTWRPHRVVRWQGASGVCPALDVSAASVFDVAHLWTAELRDSITIIVGSVIRITRPQRLSFYRAGDNLWYLGMRSWNNTTSQFNVVQPLSGPYASPTRSGGSRFRYYDASGAQLTSGGLTAGSIARVETLLVADSVTRVAGAAVDSQLVVIALRNRR
jgi:hypothetical protein